MVKWLLILAGIGAPLAIYPIQAGAYSLAQAVAAKKSRNYVVAMKEFRSLAKRDNLEAKAELGEMYQYGEGVPKNEKLALYWYSESAKSGVAAYEFRTGQMYEGVLGIPLNVTQALYWIGKAADQGYAPAQADLMLIYERGQIVPANPGLATFWKRKLEANPNFRHVVLGPH